MARFIWDCRPKPERSEADYRGWLCSGCIVGYPVAHGQRGGIASNPDFQPQETATLKDPVTHTRHTAQALTIDKHVKGMHVQYVTQTAPK